MYQQMNGASLQSGNSTGQMKNLQSQVDDKIASMVKNTSGVILRTYSINESIWQHLQNTLAKILQKHDKSSLTTPVYMVLKELVANACKANQKRVFFEERGYDITSQTDYKKGIDEYRPFVSQQMARGYSSKAKEKGYYVLISFNYNEDGLVIEVVNNTPIAVEEETIMRRKFKRAMQHDNLINFYEEENREENVQEGEGSGLGIALSIIALKNTNLHPELLRLITERDRTIARFEVPYTRNFRSKRSL